MLTKDKDEENSVSLDKLKKEGVAFFEEALVKWSRLIVLYNEIEQESNRYYSYRPEASLAKEKASKQEAYSIIVWFQDNYLHHKKMSSFGVSETLDGGKTIRIDSIFNVIFGAGNIDTIRHGNYSHSLNSGMGELRGHLASMRELEDIPKEKDESKVALVRIRKTLSRFNLFVDQLKRTRKEKMKYVIEDEYDVQNLVHSLLRIDFGDVRKEDPSPIYAGSSSRIDLVLKEEKILIEIKKTSSTLREKELGSQLIEDIAKYKEYPDATILICFIYDPEHWLENPIGLTHDLEKQSTENLNVEVIICPRVS